MESTHVSTQQEEPRSGTSHTGTQRSGSSRTGSSRTGSSIVTRLSQEWTRIARRPHAIATANQWNLPGEPVDHLDVVLERCGFDQPGNEDRHDEYLSALTRIASHDALAARIILQRILPGLVTIAVRRAPITPNGLAGAFDLVVSAAWLVIHQFPIDRRPRRVAANLLMDIEYLAFVRDTRLKSHRNENTLHPDAMLGIESGRLRTGDQPLDPISDEAALDLLLHSFASAGLSERDLQMLRAVGNDINSTEASGVLGISPRSVRNRRENALERARALLTAHDDHVR
jgi:DNA-binding CsgD family transcriptional regulator